MASSTAGQLAPFFGTGGVAQKGPLARLDQGGNLFGARLFGRTLPQSGVRSVSGHAYESGVAAARYITILTQPPRPYIVAEFKTSATDAAFSFPHLPAGNYMVIDSMCDNSRVALIYDWVVSA